MNMSFICCDKSFREFLMDAGFNTDVQGTERTHPYEGGTIAFVSPHFEAGHEAPNYIAPVMSVRRVEEGSFEMGGKKNIIRYAVEVLIPREDAAVRQWRDANNSIALRTRKGREYVSSGVLLPMNVDVSANDPNWFMLDDLT